MVSAWVDRLRPAFSSVAAAQGSGNPPDRNRTDVRNWPSRDQFRMARVSGHLESGGRGGVMAGGTKEDPWVLRTPPGSSEYTMYRDEAADPPALVCQVGSTRLTYRLRAVEDLHAWLREKGDWVP